MAKVLDLNNLFPEPPNGGRRGPLPKQQRVLDLILDTKGPQFVGYYGGYGSGKSKILCAVMIIQGLLYGGEYVIARHFMPELRRTTMKDFLEVCPKELIVEYRVADAEVHIKATNGKRAIFYFVGLDDPGKLDSLNLSGFAIDEASQVPQEAFLKLQGRLRNPNGLRKGLIVGNPKGHDWAYRMFVSKIEVQPKDRPKFHMIVAPSTENVHLPDGYIDGMLSTYSAERVKRDIMGSFDSFDGMIYSEFDRHVHVIKPFDIPKDWPRRMGGDHGFVAPAAFVWGATDHDGNLYVYREFYQREWLIEEIVKGKNGLPGISSFKEEIEAIYIDPSTKARRGQEGHSDWDVYNQYLPRTLGLIPANNDVTSGIDRVKTRFKINSKNKLPTIFIFDTCVNLVEEISEYRWAEQSAGMVGKVNEKEAPRKYKDHACDALRYLIMSYPEAAKAMDPLKAKREAPTLEGSVMRAMHKHRNPGVGKDPFGDY